MDIQFKLDSYSLICRPVAAHSSDIQFVSSTNAYSSVCELHIPSAFACQKVSNVNMEEDLKINNQ